MSYRTSLMAYRSITLVVDALTALLAWVLGGYLRYGMLWLPERYIFHADPGWVISTYAALLLALLYALGGYRTDRLHRFREEASGAIAAVALLGIAVYALVAILKLHEVSRLLLGLVMVSQGVLTLGVRAGLRWGLVLWLGHRGNPSQVLFIGNSRAAADFLGVLDQRPELNVRIVGLLTVGDERRSGPGDDGGPPILGNVNTLQSILTERVVDEVFVALSLSHESARGVTETCQREGKPVHFLLTALGPRFAYSHISTLYGTTVLSLSGVAQHSASRAVKRLFDLVGGSFILVVTSPLFLVIALAIALTSRGPVFFRQERVGLNGRKFLIYKFRTMVDHAEAMKAGLEHLNEADGPVFKITNDPRITPVGHVLRRSSLDELPQLFNVVKGDMSLVGPRPLPTSEARECLEWHRRHSMRPGMTGPWQVNGRHKLSFAEWMELDLSYVDNWSLLLDFKLLLRTIPAILGLGGV